MSSPTLNLPGQTGGNTDLETIMNLVRSVVNDTLAGATNTPGEGQIITDNSAISPFTQPFLNSAIRELYRELRNVGQPTLIKDNVIISGITPLNSPANGPGQPDPAVQVYVGFDGYFDGTQINTQLALPSDIITIERVWERQTGTDDKFIPMEQVQFGLPSRLQTQRFRQWEWRQDKVWMLGSINTNDIRLRYWCSLPQFFSPTLNLSATFVPIIDCTDAVAYKTAYKYATMLGMPGAAQLKEESREQMFQLKQQHVRRSQSVEYHRVPYGHSGAGSEAGYLAGWQ